MATKYQVNEEIKSKFLKVIAPDGTFLGNMDRDQAIKIASDYNMDLVLINQNSEIPVAKIIDYEKFRYWEEKKIKDIKKKNRVSKNSLKEVNIKVNTGSWDLKRIQKRIEEWLGEGKKVKINLLMKGREKREDNLRDFALSFLKSFISEINNSRIEGNIKENNKGFFLLISSSKDTN